MQKETVKNKLLATALDIFGRYGFEGTSTRMIANKAGVNLQAISYYFKNKEGLYIATVQQLTKDIHERTHDVRSQITHQLQDETLTITKRNAQDMLYTMLSAYLDIIIKPETVIWIRFIIREQMEPGTAFETLYNQYMGSILQLITKLIAIIKDKPETCPQIQLRTFSLVSSLLILRIGNAALLRHMQWNEIDEVAIKNIKITLKSMIEELALEPSA